MSLQSTQRVDQWNVSEKKKKKKLEKIERYAPMYKKQIAGVFDERVKQKVIEKWWEISDQSLDNILENIIDDVELMIKTFRETLSPQSFQNLLEMWSPRVQEICRNINGVYKIFKEGGKSKLLSMYRRFVHEGIKNGFDTFDWGNVWYEIEKHFQQSFGQLWDIFLQWYYSPLVEQWTKWWVIKEREGELESMLKKSKELTENISFLKENKIAFIETIDSEDNQDISQQIEKDFNRSKKSVWWKNIQQNFKKDTQKRDFLKMFTKANSGKSCNVENFIRSIDMQKKKDFQIHEELDISNINLESLSYEQYQQASFAWRKKYFLSNILGIVDVTVSINVSSDSFLNVNNNKQMFHTFVKYYIERHKIYNFSPEIIIKQYESAFKKIKSVKSIEELERYNIADEQILVSWFRYYLFNKWKTSGFVDLPKWETYGMKDLALEKLNKQNIDGNLSFVQGDIMNGGIWDTEKMLKRYDRQFIHRPINLKSSDFWIDRDTLFKDMPELYSVDNKHAKSQDIKSTLEERLEVCNKILQWEDISAYDQSFLKNIVLLNTETIWKLRSFLKYALFLMDDVEKILKNSVEDRKFLQENFQWDWGTVWPDKTPQRVLSKIINNYKWDPRKVGDLVRMRYEEKWFEETVEKMVEVLGSIKNNDTLNQKVTQVLIEDNTWNPHELSEKPSGYRDITLTLQLNNWNLVEIQFITKGMNEYKNKGKNIKDLLSIYQKASIDKLSQDDVRILEWEALKNKIIFPEDFKEMFEDWVNTEEKLYSSQQKTLSADNFYDLWREVSKKNSEYRKKLQTMEKLPNDIAWWKVIYQMTQKYLKK